jgi:hypothetical protein
LAPLPRVGQDIDSHAPEAHVRSHWHASEQSTSPHALLPLQLIVHREPPRQATSSHALSPVQLTMHVQPEGQEIWDVHGSSVVHSTVHVRMDSLHVSHASGQFDFTQ